MLAATGAGVGTSAAVGLLVPMEAGVPIPVPADFLMLLVGERVAAGHFPLWAAVAGFEAVALAGTAALFVACRGPARALIRRLGPKVGLTEDRLESATATLRRRGRPALALGRGTPGLRTITVVAAGGSGLSARRALPALVLGSSVFLQLHLVLGLLLGPAARDAVDTAKGPALAAFAVLVVLGAVFWLLRRGRRQAGQAWTEASCPACLALNMVGERVSGLGRPAKAP